MTKIMIVIILMLITSSVTAEKGIYIYIIDFGCYNNANTASI